jgi:hypothetical protein
MNKAKFFARVQARFFTLLAFAVFAALIAPLAPLQAREGLGEQTVSGRIFPLVGSGQGADLNRAPEGEPGHLYETWNRKTPSGRVQTNIMIDRVSGQTSVIETIEILTTPDGRETLSGYQQEQKQLQAFGRIELTDTAVRFEYTRDGKTKKGEEKRTGEFVVTATLPLKIAERWDDLMKGETVPIRLGVVDRQETVGFDLSKVGDSAQGQAIIRMRPSSFIIRQLVNPLHLQFSKDQRKLVRLDGRSLVKRRDGSKWADFDVTTLYQQMSAAAAPSAEVQRPAPAGRNSK